MTESRIGVGLIRNLGVVWDGGMLRVGMGCRRVEDGSEGGGS